MLLRRSERSETRERWLAVMTDHLCPLVQGIGLSLPTEIHVEHDLVRYEAAHGAVIGHCWHSDGSLDGRPQIYISPDLNNEVTIAGVILHELLHAALPAGEQHGKRFSQYAKKLGLIGPATCTRIGPKSKLKQHIEFLVRIIGPYPSLPQNAPLEIPESKDYPRMLFHRTKPPVVVKSKSEEIALGREWNRAVWPTDGSIPPSIDWAKSWLLNAGFPKTYYHRDTREQRTVNNPAEEDALAKSVLWSLFRRTN